jgi:hypothetical protein
VKGDAFVHVAVIVYTRPVPEPARSARRDTFNGPAMNQSISPGIVGASLLVTAVIAHTGGVPVPSDPVTESEI